MYGKSRVRGSGTKLGSARVKKPIITRFGGFKDTFKTFEYEWDRVNIEP